MEDFLEFLTSLVSAQTYYLRACLRMIVKLFLPGLSEASCSRTNCLCLHYLLLLKALMINYTEILTSDNSKDPEQVDSEGELFLVRKLSIHERVYEFL